MWKKNKRYILIGIVVLLLAGAIYLNAKLNSSEPSSGGISAGNDGKDTDSSISASISGGAGTDYFKTFRTDRVNTRNAEIQVLESIIKSDKTDAEALADAQEQKLEIVTCMEMEFTIESLIKAKGFNDVAVTVHKGSVNVIVDADSLSAEQVAQILDIVRSETGEPASNVKVSSSGS